MYLRYNGCDVASISFGGMFGQKAVGGWSLKFSLTFQPRQIPRGPHVDFQASEVNDLRVHVAAGSTASQMSPLGVAYCHQQRFFRINEYSSPEGRLFELVLAEGQLAALEAMRGAGGLTFKFDIYARAEGTRGAEPVQAELTKTFNLSDWTELLKNMGAAEYLCVPLLLPAVDSHDAHAGAIEHVRGAQRFMLQGEYKAAVASCRESLELLSRLHDAASGEEGPLATSAVMSAYRTNRAEMTRAQRLVFLRIAAYHLANLGHHPSARFDDVLSRQDAALSIAACAGLISASMAEGLA
jgi:hypothetical protein